MKIVTDSSVMLTKEEAEQEGITIFPLSVIVNQACYRDMETIQSETLLKEIANGATVSTSQPSVGEKVALYEENPNEYFIDITMAKGLSGTYDAAVLAKNSAPDPDKICVINSKTLCGPHRYLVRIAEKLIAQGKSMDEIRCIIEKLADTDQSYLAPSDYDFLHRGGRISGVGASLGSLLKLIPVVVKREDGTILDKLAVGRTWKRAMKHIFEHMDKHGVNGQYRFYIGHADYEERAEDTKKLILEHFPGAYVEILPLSPAFIVQGGPKCISVQAIQSYE